MYQQLADYISSLPQELNQIPVERKQTLAEITDYIQQQEHANLNFICTHNSRRSHLSQIWAQVLAHHFGIGVTTFSGGTEATAFHPNAVAAIERAGFRVTKEGDHNPRYSIHFSDASDPMICYSKRFDASPNPSRGFAAIMTCSEADAECPVVLGADQRIKLFYEDPKVSDGTDKEAETYDARCRQIARELYVVFSSIK